MYMSNTKLSIFNRRLNTEAVPEYDNLLLLMKQQSQNTITYGGSFSKMFIYVNVVNTHNAANIQMY